MGSFVDNVIKELERKGITKNKMLTDLGLSKNSFVDWKKRGTIPNAATVLRIAEYLSVPIATIIDHSDLEPTPVNITEIEWMFLDEIRKLSHDQRLQLMGYIKCLKGQEDEDINLISLFHQLPKKRRTELLRITRIMVDSEYSESSVAADDVPPEIAAK